MQKVKLILFLLGLILVVSFSQASATTYSVDADNIWFDTGLTVTATDTLCFSNSAASWTWGGGVPNFGPEGNLVGNSYLYDEWITNNRHGEMIGYIGNENPIARPSLFQNNAGLFEIGLTPVAGLQKTGYTGTLWIGFNDDFATNATGDNFGSGSVDVNFCPAPIPGSLLLLGSGILGMMGIGIRRKFA
jgi:hypothetical protein